MGQAEDTEQPASPRFAVTLECTTQRDCMVVKVNAAVCEPTTAEDSQPAEHYS